jgi:hypothetical protein
MIPKSIPVLIAAAILCSPGHATMAQTFSTPEQAYASYFHEVEVAEQQSFDLWNRDMYGPILLVNPSTRQVYSNFPDGGGALSRDGDVYSGHLPEDINIANTKTHWNGRDWAMVMLPLPDNKQDRINLLAHELFHVAQPALGFRGYSPDNEQLDEKEGRIYLRLELEALRQALEASSTLEMKRHVADALTFREYRYQLYPRAVVTENLLELNEGLAEYTGAVIAGRNRNEALYHFETSINNFVRYPTYVRSFAYVTTPTYGYLLSTIDRYWNKEISEQTNLTDYFIRAFGISIPTDLKEAVAQLEDQYDGKAIVAEETSRETVRRQLLSRYASEFVEKPHFILKFESMKISFDPRNLVPLGNDGTVYPTIRVTDNWGILDVENGALMSPKWDMITVSMPTKIDGGDISGDGWTLTLDSRYTLVHDNMGNYRLAKR